MLAYDEYFTRTTGLNRRIKVDARTSGWRRHLARVRAQGVWRTVIYLLVTVILEKLRVRVSDTFIFDEIITDRDFQQDIQFCTISNCSELTSGDLLAIRRYGGDELERDFAAAFDRGERCVIARLPDSGLASVCWIAVSSEHVAVPNTMVVIITRCFTLPEFRGRNLYAASLIFACVYIRGTITSEAPIIIESSIGNYASIRGIMKAGFRRIGTKLSVSRRDYFRPAQLACRPPSSRQPINNYQDADQGQVDHAPSEGTRRYWPRHDALFPAARAISVDILRTTADLERFLTEWNSFASTPVTGLNAFNDLLNVVAEGKYLDREVYVFVVRRGGTVECVAPMYLDRSGFKLKFSVLTLAKLRGRSLRVFGDQFIFAPAATPEECLSAVFSSLGAIRSEYDFMFLFNVPTTSPLWLHRRQITRFADGWQFVVASRRMEKVHRIIFPETYEAYLTSLSKNTRRTIRKSLRKLVEDPRIQLVRTTRAEHVPEYVLRCDKIARQSWQGKTFGCSTWDSPANREYLAQAARLGRLRSYVLLYSGQPIAFEHGFQYRGTYFGAATAYDQDYQHLGAGAVLMQLVIKDLITIEPQRVFDFGFGDAEHKRSLANATHDVASIYLVPRNRFVDGGSPQQRTFHVVCKNAGSAQFGCANKWRILLGMQRAIDIFERQVRSVLSAIRLENVVRRILKRKKK